MMQTRSKQPGGGYILEAGEYTVSVRSDSHTVLDQATFTVDSDINYSESARTTDNVVATNQLNDYTAEMLPIFPEQTDLQTMQKLPQHRLKKLM